MNFKVPEYDTIYSSQYNKKANANEFSGTIVRHNTYNITDGTVQCNTRNTVDNITEWPTMLSFEASQHNTMNAIH